MHKGCSSKRFIAVFIFNLVIAINSSAQQDHRDPVAWDTCVHIEGKTDFCVAGEKPRKFEDYLQAEWARQPLDGFSLNAGLDRVQPNDKTFKAEWREAGSLGTTKIREVRYSQNGFGRGYVLLAERTDGLYAPLLKSDSSLPQPDLHHYGQASVLVFSLDYSGNVPTFLTLAWTDSKGGPIRLDIQKSRNDAIGLIAPGHSSYDSAVDWETLHVVTWSWPGEWPGKASVRETAEIWFEIKDSKLVPKKVQLSEVDHETRHWP
jgi:hypothetical protein